MRKRPVLVGALLIGLCSVSRADQPSRRYAIIVANNLSLDEGFKPLSYADDDGAKYYELFRAAGAEVSLFAVLDPDAQKRFPEAAAAALLPRQDDILKAVKQVFGRIKADREAGRTAHFYFVYSGHGNVGPNREGYINFLDTRFRRSELYSQLLAKSPASFNHLILDACHSYFLVQKRGADDKQGDYRSMVKDFLRTEELESYPNTGVILAASSESETHEWSRWEAGIFSHELRGALLGSADVDGSGGVTYAEAAACVEAANTAIEDPKARLRVYYRSPAIRLETPLMELDSYAQSAWIHFEPEAAGRYHLEDSRGLRIADLHPSGEQPVRLALVGKQPFFLRSKDREASIPESLRNVKVSELTFSERPVSSKGSVELSFRRYLYRDPFGLGFYKGLVSSRQQIDSPPAVVSIKAGEGDRPLRTWGWIAVGTALATTLAGGITYYYADQAHESYTSATDYQEMVDWREKTEDRTLAANILFASAGAMAVTGGVLLILDALDPGPGEPPATPVVTAGEEGVFLQLFGRW